MGTKTRALWAEQDQHVGDRERLFTAVAAALDIRTVLYPGCYVDIAPSFVFEHVTYVDTDHRANTFFQDRQGVAELIAEHNPPPASTLAFVHADYTSDLPLEVDGFDLLVSLYAGFVSEHCTKHLAIGGTLLVNPSHGDAAMASIDPRLQLSGVLTSRPEDYSVRSDALNRYLQPKKPVELTSEFLHQLGRGVAYMVSPFAYLFTRVG